MLYLESEWMKEGHWDLFERICFCYDANVLPGLSGHCRLSHFQTWFDGTGAKKEREELFSPAKGCHAGQRWLLIKGTKWRCEMKKKKSVCVSWIRLYPRLLKDRPVCCRLAFLHPQPVSCFEEWLWDKHKHMHSPKSLMAIKAILGK